MENSQDLGMTRKGTPEAPPSMISSTDANQVVGSDDSVDNQSGSDFQFMVPIENEAESPTDLSNHQRGQSVCIRMPPSPINTKRVAFKDDVELVGNDNAAREVKFHSRTMPTSRRFDDAVASDIFPEPPILPVTTPKFGKMKDNRYKSFKTFSRRPDRKLSVFCGKSLKLGAKSLKEPHADPSQNGVGGSLSADRYFDALQGPELETLKPSEEIMLPEDQKWPFLLRYPVSTFGMCLGVSSQAILWKNLASNASTAFLNISLKVNLVLWFLSIVLYTVVASTYLLKVILYFEAVRREYYHPIRVNFFFAPWIALLFLAIGVPRSVTTELPQYLWYVLMTPIFCLELKIYGQWMSGGQRRLSKVANPSNHLSVVGNFVGALLGASMGLREGPLFFFAVGLAHYTVLFVTLYQRLPTNQTLPKELHPVFFLFVAAPSVASMAWAKLSGSFDFGSRITYFIALFLYFSLRIQVFVGMVPYTFPMTGAAITTIKYSNEVSNIVTKILAVTLSTIATVAVTGLLITTVLHAFVLQDLFPNDIGIAISCTKAETQWKWPHHQTGSSEDDSVHFLQSTNSDDKDVEKSQQSSVTTQPQEPSK